MERTCVQCGKTYTPKRSDSKTCGPTCRSRKARGLPPTVGAKTIPTGTVSTDIAGLLQTDLTKLGVFDSYEARTALGIALQLDEKVVQGAAYVSLSKELDRRVDALRLKAERPDDPTRVIRERIEEKQQHLRLA